jgi:hypothetical protein
VISYLRTCILAYILAYLQICILSYSHIPRSAYYHIRIFPDLHTCAFAHACITARQIGTRRRGCMYMRTRMGICIGMCGAASPTIRAASRRCTQGRVCYTVRHVCVLCVHVRDERNEREVVSHVRAWCAHLRICAGMRDLCAMHSRTFAYCANAAYRAPWCVLALVSMRAYGGPRVIAARRRWRWHRVHLARAGLLVRVQAFPCVCVCVRMDAYAYRCKRVRAHACR